MGFFRTAEPAAPTWVDAGSGDGWGEAAAPTGHGEDVLDDVAAGLFQPRLEWFAGQSRSTLHERSPEELAALAAQLQDGSEAVVVPFLPYGLVRSGCNANLTVDILPVWPKSSSRTSPLVHFSYKASASAESVNTFAIMPGLEESVVFDADVGEAWDKFMVIAYL